MPNELSTIPKRIKNYFFPTQLQSIVFPNQKGGQKNLSQFITPIQLQRLRHDVLAWRQCIEEAENAWFPFRVKIQRLFQDTILNGHVIACMNRRKNLTLLRNFKICDSKGKEYPDITKLFKKSWFYDFQNFSMDSIFFGYSLISLGDMVNNEYPELSLVRRANISPDRKNMGSLIYQIDGYNFTQDPYKEWHIWIPTTSEIGVSNCGYGLLYPVGLYEIFCRNVLGFNGDFVELFAQPYRVGKTPKVEESERAEFEAALRNLGSSGYAVLDMLEEIEFVDSKAAGTGYKSYESLEKRCEEKISKIILGYAKALDPEIGKLGSQDDRAEDAMDDIQNADARFMLPIINNELIPRMRSHGINIPMNLHFEYVNDTEAEDFRKKEDASNAATAAIALTMSQAGLKMDPQYFSQRTGIPITEDAPLEGGENDPNAKEQSNNLTKNIKNKLDQLYHV